jgi:hypothetical protein
MVGTPEGTSFKFDHWVDTGITRKLINGENENLHCIYYKEWHVPCITVLPRRMTWVA